jgi:Cys-tRNA(Pro)/Cys-tRNA(Cys) deacylase
MADPRAAERSSGYVVGAISPLGHKRPLRTFVDGSALGFDTMFCSGGRRGLEIELAPGDLVVATGAVTGPIARW